MNNYKRKKEPIENRQLILDSAMQVISEVGLAKASLDTIAKKAGLSKGGLLHHFPRKEALIEELCRSILAGMTDLIEAGIEQGMPRHVAYLVASFEDDPDDIQKMAVQVLLESGVHDEHFRIILQQWYKDNVIADFSKSTPQENAAVFLADGYWYGNIFGKIQLTKQQRDEMIKMFIER
jgi:AcrR family transcriptional regulator